MARPQIDVNVETAEILIAGVWYSIAEVNKLIDQLEDIMDARDWRFRA
jgi:hypothetical protein